MTINSLLWRAGALTTAAVATVAIGLVGSGAHADPLAGRAPYTIGLFGDLPYAAAGRAEFPALRQDINRQHVVFSLFDGDLKSGSERCDDSLYTTSKRRFDAFVRPVVVVPGDNDWTDCHRANNGGYDPENRLGQEREILYSTPHSLGHRTLRVARQRDYPENTLFRHGPVSYVGLNVQGSNNNFAHPGVDGEDRPRAEIARQDAEYRARNAADKQWLAQAFTTAKQHHDRAVMVWWQADPNFDNEMHLADPRSYDGLTDIVAALREQTLHFDGQVVLVHGDSHYFKIDKPLNYDNGQVLANFTRVETFGELNSQWVSATVDPNDSNVFTFRPQLVKSNVDNR
jgi:hypothetical protein